MLLLSGDQPSNHRDAPLVATCVIFRKTILRKGTCPVDVFKERDGPWIRALAYFAAEPAF